MILYSLFLLKDKELRVKERKIEKKCLMQFKKDNNGHKVQLEKIQTK